MNKWIAKSLELAQKKDYLDRLQNIYKLPRNESREIESGIWEQVEEAYHNKKSAKLIKILLELELFPIKHSFVAYFRRDLGSIERNPETVEQIADSIYAIDIDELRKKCEEPKETNRQMGPLFKNFLMSEDFGIEKMLLNQFKSTKNDSILIASDAESKDFATQYLGYERNKGLDIIFRINGEYTIGEAKFLTDFGGHQNAQLDDAISTLNSNVKNCEKILILDGVLFIANSGKMYQTLTTKYKNENIISSVLLKEFISEKIGAP